MDSRIVWIIIIDFNYFKKLKKKFGVDTSAKMVSQCFSFNNISKVSTCLLIKRKIFNYIFSTKPRFVRKKKVMKFVSQKEEGDEVWHFKFIYALVLFTSIYIYTTADDTLERKKLIMKKTRQAFLLLLSLIHILLCLSFQVRVTEARFRYLGNI